MNLIQKMEDESNCMEAIFQSYIVSRSKNKIFLFFEGKDDFNYYWCRLAPYIGAESYEQYVCNSKANVLLINRLISKKTKREENEKLLFFVDQDFEKNPLTNPDIYVTPTYSIENFYVSDNAIKNMIRGVWGLSGELGEDDKNDFDIAINYLIDRRKEVIDSILYSNAWYSVQYNKTRKNPPFPKFSVIKDYNMIKGIESKEYLNQLVPNSIDVSDEEIADEILYLSENAVSRIRGKYFEQTMPHYIMKIFQDSNKKNGREYFSKKRKVNINVCSDNMVTVLSNYADVPKSLIEYITWKFLDKNRNDDILRGNE